MQNISGIYKVSLKILIWSKRLTLLFGYIQQYNYKIDFLARRLGTRLWYLAKLWIKKIHTFIVAISMNVYIFSSPINIFKTLSTSSHNIKSVLSSSIFLWHKQPYSINSISLASRSVKCFQDMLLKFIYVTNWV